MSKEYLRIWVEKCDAEIEEIGKHLLLVGELFGDCNNCKEMGLDYASVKECPSCHTVFQYIASRNSSTGGDRLNVVKRILPKRPELTFIDYEDYKRITGRLKTKELFLQ